MSTPQNLSFCQIHSIFVEDSWFVIPAIQMKSVAIVPNGLVIDKVN